MEPTTYRLAFGQEPPDLLERLRGVLAGQGSPEITADRENGQLRLRERYR
jgi:hypothetical protein